MSRQQIAQFSAFLMQWVSETTNHETVANAVASAIKAYNDEREAPQAALGELTYNFDVDACAFELFSKEEFFKLCQLVTPLQSQSQVQRLVGRILGIKSEYDRTVKAILEKRTSDKLDASQCEYWRRIEFSRQDIELLKMKLTGKEASELWAKLPPALSEQEEVGFQYFLERVKKLGDQVGTVTKTVAAAARSKAIDLTGENSAASFTNSSLASPNARDFLLRIDTHQGSWGVASASLFSGRTSLKSRMIHAVCDAFYRSKTRHDALQKEIDDGFLEISDQAASLQEGARVARLSSAATYESIEARVLQLYAEKKISPLTEPGHALEIYQCLLAIDYAAKVERLTRANVSGAQDVRRGGPVDAQHRQSGDAEAALARPPQRPNGAALFTVRNGDDDDDVIDSSDNRRSVRNFGVASIPQ